MTEQHDLEIKRIHSRKYYILNKDLILRRQAIRKKLIRMEKKVLKKPKKIKPKRIKIKNYLIIPKNDILENQNKILDLAKAKKDHDSFIKNKQLEFIKRGAKTKNIYNFK